MHDLITAFAGKYGLYVLPAYGLSALVLVALTLDSLFRARRWKRAAEARDALHAHSSKDKGE